MVVLESVSVVWWVADLPVDVSHAQRVMHLGVVRAFAVTVSLSWCVAWSVAEMSDIDVLV